MSEPLTNPLVCKLEQFALLSDADKQTIDEAISDVRTFESGADVITEGERPDHVHLLLEGWAGRSKGLPNGDRQILAYLIPGDLCDVHITLLKRMDHSITALSSVKVAFIPRSKMEAILDDRTALSRAIWWSTLVDEAILREWLLNIGQRPADERLAHLICEMALRGKPVGLAKDGGFELPLTQVQFADSMGLTPVHINRTLKVLRVGGMIAVSGRRVTIKDLPRLMAYCDFDPSYLHQEPS